MIAYFNAKIVTIFLSFYYVSVLSLVNDTDLSAIEKLEKAFKNLSFPENDSASIEIESNIPAGNSRLFENSNETEFEVVEYEVKNEIERINNISIPEIKETLSPKTSNLEEISNNLDEVEKDLKFISAENNETFVENTTQSFLTVQPTLKTLSPALKNRKDVARAIFHHDLTLENSSDIFPIDKSNVKTSRNSFEEDNFLAWLGETKATNANQSKANKTVNTINLKPDDTFKDPETYKNFSETEIVDEGRLNASEAKEFRSQDEIYFNSMTWLDSFLIHHRSSIWVIANTTFMSVWLILALFSLYRLLGLPWCTPYLTRTQYLVIHLLIFTAATFKVVQFLHLSYGSYEGLPLFLTLLLTHTSSPCLAASLIIVSYSLFLASSTPLFGRLFAIPPSNVSALITIVILVGFCGDIVVGITRNNIVLICVRVLVMSLCMMWFLLFLCKCQSIGKLGQKFLRELKVDLKSLPMTVEGSTQEEHDAKRHLKKMLLSWCKVTSMCCVLGVVMCALNFGFSMFFTCTFIPLWAFWVLHSLIFTVEVVVVFLLMLASCITLDYKSVASAKKFFLPYYRQKTCDQTAFIKRGDFIYQRVSMIGPTSTEDAEVIRNNITVNPRSRSNLRRSATFSSPTPYGVYTNEIPIPQEINQASFQDRLMPSTSQGCEAFEININELKNSEYYCRRGLRGSHSFNYGDGSVPRRMGPYTKYRRKYQGMFQNYQDSYDYGDVKNKDSFGNYTPPLIYGNYSTAKDVVTQVNVLPENEVLNVCFLPDSGLASSNVPGLANSNIADEASFISLKETNYGVNRNEVNNFWNLKCDPSYELQLNKYGGMDSNSFCVESQKLDSESKRTLNSIESGIGSNEADANSPMDNLHRALMNEYPSLKAETPRGNCIETSNKVSIWDFPSKYESAVPKNPNKFDENFWIDLKTYQNDSKSKLSTFSSSGLTPTNVSVTQKQTPPKKPARAEYLKSLQQKVAKDQQVDEFPKQNIFSPYGKIKEKSAIEEPERKKGQNINDFNDNGKLFDVYDKNSSIDFKVNLKDENSSNHKENSNLGSINKFYLIKEREELVDRQLNNLEANNKSDYCDLDKETTSSIFTDSRTTLSLDSLRIDNKSEPNSPGALDHTDSSRNQALTMENGNSCTVFKDGDSISREFSDTESNISRISGDPVGVSVKRNHSIAGEYNSNLDKSKAEFTNTQSSGNLGLRGLNPSWYDTWNGKRKRRKQLPNTNKPAISKPLSSHLSNSKSSLTNLYTKIRTKKSKSLYYPPVIKPTQNTDGKSLEDILSPEECSDFKDLKDYVPEELIGIELPNISEDINLADEILKSSETLYNFYSLKRSDLKRRKVDRLINEKNNEREGTKELNETSESTEVGVKGKDNDLINGSYEKDVTLPND